MDIIGGFQDLNLIELEKTILDTPGYHHSESGFQHDESGNIIVSYRRYLAKSTGLKIELAEKFGDKPLVSVYHGGNMIMSSHGLVRTSVFWEVYEGHPHILAVKTQMQRQRN